MGRKNSESQLLQNYAVLFKNVKKDTVLAAELATYGYDEAVITQGETLFNTLKEKYTTNKTETADQTTAYAVFSQHLDNLVTLYTTDRKKAKIVFKNQPDVLKNLQLNGLVPVRNAARIDTIRHFYETLNNNTELTTALNRLKIDQPHITQALTQVTATQDTYASYVQEKGESQQATKDKNKAFDDVAKWVNEFYAVAKIALEDQPQLLETVAKLVRS